MQPGLISFGYSLFFLKDFSIFCYTVNTLELQIICLRIQWIILIFIETFVSNCLTRMFSTFFLNLIQFDAKLARVQTKSKSYPDSTVLPHSIYRRVCEFFLHSCCLKKLILLVCFHKGYIY